MHELKHGADQRPGGRPQHCWVPHSLASIGKLTEGEMQVTRRWAHIPPQAAPLLRGCHKYGEQSAPAGCRHHQSPHRQRVNPACCHLATHTQATAEAHSPRVVSWPLADRCYCCCSSSCPCYCQHQLLLAPRVHPHHQLGLLKHKPADAGCRRELHQVGQHALQATWGARSAPWPCAQQGSWQGGAQQARELV
jgi:hypothetical protein